MTHDPATELFARCSRALARGDGRDATLQALLSALRDELDVGSVAIFVLEPRTGSLELAATSGLSEPATTALAAAVQNPAHPIARTASDGVSTFDVLPTAPGGPAIRSHLPLVATLDGEPVVVGVLAVAHEEPMTPNATLLEAIADLAAAAIRGRA
jgi:hypothetical protein